MIDFEPLPSDLFEAGWRKEEMIDNHDMGLDRGPVMERRHSVGVPDDRLIRLEDEVRSLRILVGGVPAHREARLPDVGAEELAAMFHEAYERLAPDFGYRTREESAVAWDDVPKANQELMIAVAREILG